MENSLDTGKDKRIHILVVDDEDFLIRMWKMSMERRGYKVSPFTDCLEALKVFKENPAAFDIAITDQIMPGMTGVAFATHILKIRKNLPVILCTG